MGVSDLLNSRIPEEEIEAVGTIAYQYGYIIDSEREIVQQLCAK